MLISHPARHRWAFHYMPWTWEAENRRITTHNQPGLLEIKQAHIKLLHIQKTEESERPQTKPTVLNTRFGASYLETTATL